jgi:hypothetical protein
MGGNQTRRSESQEITGMRFLKVEILNSKYEEEFCYINVSKIETIEPYHDGIRDRVRITLGADQIVDIITPLDDIIAAVTNVVV